MGKTHLKLAWYGASNASREVSMSRLMASISASRELKLASGRKYPNDKTRTITRTCTRNTHKKTQVGKLHLVGLILVGCTGARGPSGNAQAHAHTRMGTLWVPLARTYRS
jgi:hypothetical protein